MAATDYVAATNAKFEFADDSDYSTTSITIQLTNDNIVENTRETFSLNIASTNAAIVTNSAVGTIVDDEGMTLVLVDDEAEEGVDKTFDFKVTLSHQVAVDFPLAVATIARNSDYYAQIGVDFEAMDEVLVVKAGTQSQTFAVNILDDNIQENFETFEVQVSYVASEGNDFKWEYGEQTAAGEDKTSVTGTFKAETEGVTICVQNLMQAEGAAEVMAFSVTISHAVDTDLPVSVKTVAGSTENFGHVAEEGADKNYQDVVRTFTFEAGTTDDKVFEVTVGNDNFQSANSMQKADADFGPLNFGVQFSIGNDVYRGATGDAVNYFNILPCGSTTTTGAARGEIYDFEDVTVSLEASAMSMSEAAGSNITFSVKLSHTVLAGESSLARGASFSWVDPNTANPSTGDATLALSTQVGNVALCAVDTAFGSSTMPATGPTDLCWPTTVIPNSATKTDGTVFSFASSADAINDAKTMSLTRGPDDFIVEGPETFGVAIMLDQVTQAGYAIRAADDSTVASDNMISLVLTLEDDELTGGVTVSDDVDGAEANLATLTYDVTLTHTVAVDVTMKWNTNTIGASAIEGVDFDKTGSLTLEFPAFSAPGTKQQVTIDILNDDIQEDTETFAVVFSDVQSENLLTVSPITKVSSITDEESLTLTINSMTVALDESVESFPFLVTLSHQADFDISVEYAAAVDSTATSKALLNRFDATTSKLTFPAFSTELTADVLVTNDNVQTGASESEQAFKVVVDVSDTAIKAATSTLTAAALVSDNEGVVVTISEAFATEGTDAFASFTVALSHAVSEPVSIVYSTVVCTDGDTCSSVDGTLNTGRNDFTEATAATLVMPADTQSKVLQVRLNDDNVQEYQEHFSVKLTSVSVPADSGFKIDDAMQQANVTIYDDEAVVASIGDASALEGGDLSFLVKLTHKVNSDVEVFYTINSGSAVFGSDFGIPDSALSTGSVVIPKSAMGASARPTATVVIKAINDDVAELAETFTISLLRAVAGENMATILLPTDTTGTGTGTIGNPNFYDEDVTVEVRPAAGPVDRGTDATFEVVLSHAIDHRVSVSYATSDRTATAGVDYSTSAGTLSFPSSLPADGETYTATPLTITVPTIRNTCQQRQVEQTLRVAVSAPSGFQPSMGVLNQIATISPFDHMPVATVTDATANEGENMVFTVSLSHCIGEDLNVGYKVDGTNSAATAYPGRDFLVQPTAFITFSAASPMEQTFAISLTNNNVQGLTKEFFVKIGTANPPMDNADDFLVTFPNATAKATIVDDEGVTIQVTPCVAQRPSVDTDFKFTVSLSHAVETMMELDYTTEATTAVEDVDFEATAGKLQYTVGTSGDRVVSVTTINRPNVVQPGTTGADSPTRFNLVFSPASAQVLTDYNIKFDDTTGKGAIMGKDSTNVVLPRVTATEGDRAIFTATVADELSTAVVIGFQTTGADSVAGKANPLFDLRNAVGNFTFLPNAGVNQQVSFAIEFFDDYLVEIQENFDIQLTVLEPAGYEGSVINFDGVQQGHIILDNDFATLSVQDSSANENGDMVFNVVLSHLVYEEVSVDLTPSGSCAEGLACIVLGSVAPAESTTADLLVPASGSSTVVFSPTTQAERIEGGTTQLVSFRVLNDDVIEPTETFLVTAVTNSGLVGAGSRLVATGSIVDDEGASFVFSSPAGLEGEKLLFTVGLTHAISTSFQVDYSTVGINPRVFATTSSFFTLHPSDPTNSFEIQTVDNNVLSPSDVTFNVQTDAITPSAVIAQGVATGTLINDDENAVMIVTVASADENAASPKLNFVTTLQTPTTSAFTVNYATRDLAGQAVASEDYVSNRGSYEFNGNLLESMTVVVDVIPDDIVEDDEHVGFEVAVTTSGYADLIQVIQADGVIVDDESAEIEIRDARVQEGENAELVFTVFLSHEVGSNTDFKLTYNAFAGAEANAASDQDRNLASGERGGKDFTGATGATTAAFEGNRGAITVAIHDDYIVEVQEVLQVEVTSVSSKFTLASTIATGTIGDDDFATVAIESISASETDGEVSLTVTMSHLTEPEMTVSYKTIDGFATSTLDVDGMKNVDYDAKQGVVTFLSVFDESDTDTRQAKVTVTVTDDALVEEAFEDFCVSLRDITSPVNIGASIDDDNRDGFVALRDDAEAATISVADVKGAEGESLTFLVVMSHGIQAADFKVGFETVDVTAEAGSDYTAASGEVTFAASVTTGKHAAMPFIEVATASDDEVEYDELFEVHLTSINGGAAVQGVASSVALGESTLSFEGEIAWGFITDARGVLSQNKLSIEDATADESDGTISFTVYFPRRTDNHLDNNEPVTFTWSTFAGTAIPERDYDTTEDTVTIPGDVESVTIRVPVVDNDWVQGDHTFSVFITSASPIDRATATGTIVDNDVATLTIGDGVGAETEDGFVVFPVELSNLVASKLSFTYSTRSAAADIVTVSNSFFEMESGNTVGEIKVAITNDDVQEGDESFSLDATSLLIFNSNIATDAVTWSDEGSSAVGTITDDEHATVSIDSVSALESAGIVRFNLALSHEIKIANEVVFSVVSESAIEGSDFTVRGEKVVSFATRAEAGAQAQDVLIVIEDDGVVEGDEVFRVVLTDSTNGIYLADETTATVTITDDDFATVSIMDLSGVESQGTFDFEVVLSHEVAARVSVSATASNTQGDTSNPELGFANGASSSNPVIANAGINGMVIQPDFQIGSSTVSLGATGATVSVAVYDDIEQECDEDFTMTLSNLLCGSVPCGNMVTLSKAEATGSLINDDEGLTITATSVEHSEAISSFEFTLTLSHAVDHEFEVTTSIQAEATARSRLLACTDLSIEQCATESGMTETVAAHMPSGIFASLNTWRKTMSVNVRDDRIAQAPGLFQLVASTNLKCGSLGITGGQGTIIDNEQASIEIISLSALEDGDHPMTIKLSHAIEADLTVGFLVTDGDSVDFNALSGEVTFQASTSGQSAVAQVDVRAETEAIETDKDYTVAVTQVPSWLVNVGSATLTIVDDEIRGSFVYVAEGVTAVEGEMLEFEVTLVGDHENDLALDYAFAGDSAVAGVNFKNYAGDLYWAAGDLSPRTVRIPTIFVAGCNSDKVVSLVLSGVTGGSALSNKEFSMSTPGVITDADGSTISVSALDSVPSGETLVVTASSSSACDFPITVPVTISGAAEGQDFVANDLTCTIAADANSCTININTMVTAEAAFSVAIAVNDFAAANTVFSAGTVDDTATTGEISAAATGAGVTAAVDSVSVTLAVGADFAKQMDVASLFLTGSPDVTYSVGTASGLTAGSIAGSVLTLSTESIGASVLVVTATTPEGSASAAVNVAAAVVNTITMKKLAASPVEIKQGEYYQRVVSKVLNDPAHGNFDGCAATTGNDGTNSDCCVVASGSIENQVCERTVQANRQLRLESVRISLFGAELGESEVCIGSSQVAAGANKYPGLSFCFTVTVVA